MLTGNASFLMLFQRTSPRFAVRTWGPGDRMGAQRSAGEQLSLLGGQLLVEPFGQVHGFVTGNGVMDADRNGSRHLRVVTRAIGHFG